MKIGKRTVRRRSPLVRAGGKAFSVMMALALVTAFVPTLSFAASDEGLANDSPQTTQDELPTPVDDDQTVISPGEPAMVLGQPLKI